MTDRNPQRARLSPARQALLEQRLRGAFAGQDQGNRISKRPAQAPSPLSFSQQRLWFLDLLGDGSSQYNNSIAQRLTGHLNMSILEQSIQEIVRRHESLRASFEAVEGQPAQRIAPVLRVPVHYLDLRNISESARREETLQSLAREYTGAPFDLAAGPVLRVAVMQLAEDEHVLLVVIHHISSDGWSLSIFWKEFVALYDAFSSGQPSPLEELPIQYADYAAWQRSILVDEHLERQLGYWREHLAGVPTVLELPTDYRHPAKQSFRGARYPLTVNEALTTRLKEFAQQEGLTPFMVLLAAYATLLYRYTGQRDFLVGTPIAGRMLPETEPLIGFFVNTLVLRMDLSGDPSFRVLLKRVNAAAAGAYAHQELPFEKIVEALQPERTLSHNPLFQVSFAYENVLSFASSPANVRASTMTIDNGTSKFDLGLELMETDGRLQGSFEYSTDLFAEDTIARMAGHFQTLLEGIALHSEGRLSQLPLVSEQEYRQLTAPSAEMPVSPLLAQAEAGGEQGCIHQLFEAQVRQTPEAVAVTDGQGQLTYSELNERANQVAHTLRDLGVGPEVRVGLCVERSLELIVGLLGILKAGGAYVPIDPATPRERLSFILADTQAPVLLTQQPLLRLVSPLPSRPDGAGPSPQPAHVLCLDTQWSLIAQASPQNPLNRSVAPNSAYLIYTSGSTGLPKGVLVSHANVTRLFAATEAWYQFGPQDTWTLFHSYAFDFAVWELWGALLYGGRLVLVPRLVAQSPDAFYGLLVREQVSVLNQTPSAFGQLLHHEEGLPEAPPLALRYVIFGGEALSIQSLHPWFQRHQDQRPRLINMYGITETTVHVTYRPLTKADVLREGGSPIGVPLPDLSAYVLDQSFQLVPLGVPGELYVGGAGLARGYLHRPALTAERFLPHPFSPHPGARLYKTGDLVRYRPNGDLEYLGRIDHQVKIRGFRIEPGEIEAVLQHHPAVREAIVLVREDQAGDKRLIAYLVPAARQERPAVESLRQHLQARLPDYMIPAAFVWLDEMPLTTHGKIDRAALPAPEQDRPEQEVPFVAPATQIEATVAEVWAETLGINQVGAVDNFFALGGDSIRSVRVVALLKQRGLSCSLPQLFQHQTVRELARVLVWNEPATLAGRSDQPPALIEARDRQKLPAEIEDAYPATKLQLGMLFHSDYEHDSTLYHTVISWHLHARFDQPSLEQALQFVTARHQVLRTSFDVSTYGEPLQLVHKTVSIPLQIEDLRHLATEEQEQQIRAWLLQERNRRFNWAQPPLLRFHVHRRAKESFQLTLTNHHAVLDGWSVGVLLTELLQAYMTAQEGQEVGANLISAPAAYFRDFVTLEQEAIASESVRRYWQEKLQEPHIIKLPRRGARQQTAEAQHRQELYTALSPEVARGLLRLARQANVPLKSVLLAAHLRVMSVLGGEMDVLTGLAASGRPEGVDSERALGLFLNSVPFRQKLAGGSWLDLVQETFQNEQEVLPFQRYPFAQLQLEHGGHLLFEALFNYTHFHVYQGLQGLPLKVVDTQEFTEVDFALTTTFDLDAATSELRLILQYDPAAFSEEQMQATAGYYISALTSMAHTPNERYEAQAMLSPAEEQQLLVTWNATETNYPRNQCVHQLFEQQVELTPEAIAVVFEDQLLTYQAINSRANQLAHRLQQLGGGPEVRIGLCLERSLDLVIALLAVLKAGGVYVPLDPRYPQERLAFMFADAQIAVLLTQSGLRAQLPPGDATVVCLDEDWQQIAQQPTDNLNSGAVAENLAYVIYTSGSTGRPKGVCVTHQAVVRLVKETSYVQFTAKERFLQFAPISFDAATFEIWGSLLNGAVLVVPPPSELSLDELGKLLKHGQITTLWLTAGLFHLLVEEHLDSLEQIHQLLAGGDVLWVSHVRRVLQHLKGSQLINGYGPTESTTFACCYSIDDVTRFDETVPIGRPIANTQVYVLDRNLQLVPVGVAGELYIGGAGLARGYLNRPDLTAERFIPHPFSRDPGVRLYRTGDLVRYRTDGALEFLGRKDRQVKVRGFRVEVGEIESMLNQHPDIREAIVMAREMPPGEKRLVAYVVPHRQPEPSIQDLRGFLKERLPEYMMPAAFVVLDGFTLTPNGKVDYQALGEPEWRGSEQADTYVAPKNPLEEKLAAIWAELFKVSRVGVNDNFFELGGHSLLAMQVTTRVRNNLGFNLPLRMLFEAPTVAKLAEALEQFQSAPGPSGASARLRQPIRRASINQGEASPP